MKFKPGLLLVTCFLLFAHVLVAQPVAMPVIKLESFSGDGISSAELLILERLIASYVIELRSFRVISDESLSLALTEYEKALALGSSDPDVLLLNADFIVSGTVARIQDNYVVTLKSVKVSTGEKLVVSDSFSSVNDIVLRSRVLTRTLFQRTDAATSDGSPVENSPTTAAIAYKAQISNLDLVGTWRGDRNIESIRLFADGSGVAVLSAGGTLRLRYEIQQSRVTIYQNQANDPRMFRTDTIDHALAMRIAAQARPMRWEFQLSTDGLTLAGIKYGIAVSGTAASFSVDNTYATDMHWAKVGR